MEVNYFKLMQRERFEVKSFPDLPDEQVEKIYCDLIFRIRNVASNYDLYVMLGLLSIIGVVFFFLLLFLLPDLNKKQSAVILIGLFPSALSWIYFSVGAYLMTMLQSKIQRALKYFENEYPSVADNTTNKAILIYKYFDNWQVSYARTLTLTILLFPIYGLSIFWLMHLGMFDYNDILSNSLIISYVFILFSSVNILYIKHCKSKI